MCGMINLIIQMTMVATTQEIRSLIPAMKRNQSYFVVSSPSQYWSTNWSIIIAQAKEGWVTSQISWIYRPIRKCILCLYKGSISPSTLKVSSPGLHIMTNLYSGSLVNFNSVHSKNLSTRISTSHCCTSSMTLPLRKISSQYLSLSPFWQHISQ